MATSLSPVFSLNDTCAKTQISQGGSRKPAAELLEKTPLLEMGQFLHEDCIADDYLQHAAPHPANAGLFRSGISHGLGPGLLQANALLPPAPASGRHQPA